MKPVGEFQRKVVQVIKTDQEAVSTGRGFTWKKTYEYEITAECGHKRVKRGFAVHVPKTFAPCKACAQGEPQVPVEGELGMIDKSDNNMTEREREVAIWRLKDLLT